MSPKERYEPGPEEMKATESTMSKRQTRSSGRREVFSKKFDLELLKKCNLKAESVLGKGGGKVSGTVSGNTIEIAAFRSPGSLVDTGWTGTVNGNSVGEETARKLYEKFFPIAAFIQADRSWGGFEYEGEAEEEAEQIAQQLLKL